MQISSVNSVAFKAAKVDSPSPLVSGTWQFVSDNPAQTVTAAPKKESHWFRKTLYWIAGIAVATAAFVGLRNTKAINSVMESGGFKAQKGFTKKAAWCVGKIGDGAKWLKGMTWDKVAKLFKKGEKGAPKPPADSMTVPAEELSSTAAEAAGVAESAAGAAGAAV